MKSRMKIVTFFLTENSMIANHYLETVLTLMLYFCSSNTNLKPTLSVQLFVDVTTLIWAPIRWPIMNYHSSNFPFTFFFRALSELGAFTQTSWKNSGSSFLSSIYSIYSRSPPTPSSDMSISDFFELKGRVRLCFYWFVISKISFFSLSVPI